MFRLARGMLPRLFIAFILTCGVTLWLGSPIHLPPVQAQAITSTPNPDGSIVHIVQDGENLASIAEAYGVTMASIRGMNGMAPTSNLIFPGQTLIIRLPLPPTETPTLTPSIPRPTRTPTLEVPTRTPRPTRTPTPTLLPSETPNPVGAAVTDFLDANRRALLIGMAGVCAAGLLWTLWFGFRPSASRPK
jgi:hypothetical protein